MFNLIEIEHKGAISSQQLRICVTLQFKNVFVNIAEENV